MPEADSGSTSSDESRADSPDTSLLKYVRLAPSRSHVSSSRFRRIPRHCVAAGIMIFLSTAFVLYLSSGFIRAGPVPYMRLPRTPLIVSLPGYGSFEGTQILASMSATQPFNAPVDAWLGIEYAKPPIGDLRFSPPQWPAQFNGSKAATMFGPACVQSYGGSEDCLTANFYRTSGIPITKKLPVLVFIHGGGFVGGSGKSFDGATFVSKSLSPIMVVAIQYRLGALGSLPSRLMEEEGLLNLGIRDQRLALEFVQKYITNFGGDPRAVTLGGQSAGAHSVALHLFHNYGVQRKELFSKAIIASGAPTARTFPEATCPLNQRFFSEFMSYIACPEAPNKDALACLRAAPVASIRHISASIMKASDYNITWPWQPVSPGPLLEKRGSQSGYDGTFFKVPLLISSCTDEGRFFAPRDLTTTEQYTSFLSNMNPGLTKDDLTDLETLYPDPSLPTSPYANSPKSTQFARLSAAWGDYAYICPVQETAGLFADKALPVYKARFNTPNYNADWQGVPHAADASYFNGIPNVQFPEISKLYTTYFSSFVAAGDPNLFAIDGAPRWEKYARVGGKELVVGSIDGVGTGMETEGDTGVGGSQGIRMEACRWWRDPERMRRLKK
ncbi:Alpha/Beta hydrolase protein [Dendryphion nanum]|uniref:Carboxylic ester hydrolase n=1 Tax=Dendryphion nanum TaxID=256645 RepID=A0A9P9D7E8_9PLEO|nr:Alpha/Beta hydrolase protein [Dendryphion nanum]